MVVREEKGEVPWEEDGGDAADLELALSLGARGGVPRRELCRILTAKDFPTAMASKGSPISSSSSSSSSPNLDGVCATKSQVIGWPPIRAYRMNSMMSNVKNKDDRLKKTPGGAAFDQNASAGKNPERKASHLGSRFVKVNMDGMPIGRKVDLGSHYSYEALAMALQDMFDDSNLSSSKKGLKLLDGASGFVLTYEDRDGDWLLVGDVPWSMFTSSVKRLRIMKTADAGAKPGLQTH